MIAENLAPRFPTPRRTTPHNRRRPVVPRPESRRKWQTDEQVFKLVARDDPGLHRRQLGGEAPGRRDDLTRVRGGARHRPYVCWPVWQGVRLIGMVSRGHTGASAGANESKAGPARLIAPTLKSGGRTKGAASQRYEFSGLRESWHDEEQSPLSAHVRDGSTPVFLRLAKLRRLSG